MILANSSFLLSAAMTGVFQLSSMRLEVAPDLRIGSEEAPEYQFSSIADAVVDAAGNIYVVMTLEDEVRVFDARGRFVRRLGRRGKGPGEFMGPSAIGWLGDSLWVRDRELRRFVVFDPAGEEARTLPALLPKLPASVPGSPDAPVFVRAVLRDGSTIAMTGPGGTLDEGYAMPQLIDATRSSGTPLLRVTPDGDAATSLQGATGCWSARWARAA